VSQCHVVSDSSGGSVLAYGAADRCSIPKSVFFFVITMYNMIMEAVKINLFLILCIYLFSFFLYPHSKATGAQLVYQRLMTELN
jgi:hypothetical protein